MDAPRRALVALALPLSFLLAGCLAAPESTGLGLDAGASRATPPTVVAVVDSGANPYHVAFRGGPTFAEVPGLPADARALDLTLDAATYEAAADADEALWSGVRAGNIVWFPGTRLASVSITKADERFHALDEQGHGTLVSHAVVAAAPHAVVLLVQVGDDEELPEAMRWIAKQPWIDVVSLSWGTHPQEVAEGEVAMGLPEAYAEVARAGKPIFNGAGNYPWPHFAIEHSAPPFVVAVGGAREAHGGDAWLAARAPDIVSAFVHKERALVGTLDEFAEATGTSLACPMAAGAVAEALWLVRDAVGARETGVTAAGALVEAQGEGALEDGALTADELRDAMNRAAVHWSATDWSPPDTNEQVYQWGVPVVAAAAQMGWGYVGPDESAAIAGHLLGTAPLPEKPADVQAFMQANLAARYAIWGGA